MGTTWASKRAGFTIVELLIIIVVIGILSAIVLVAYSGIQERARYSVMQGDLDTINKAILLYHAKNGVYPDHPSSSKCTTATSNQTLEITGLVPEYISKIPSIPQGAGGYYTYCRNITGPAVEYKLVRLVPDDEVLPELEQANPRIDPKRASPPRGWGYWSSEHAGDDL